MALFSKLFKSDPVPTPKPAPAPVREKETYDFIAHYSDPKCEKRLQKYQKFWTDPEDKYDGMTLREFKEEGYPGDKVWQYPPLDVDVDLKSNVAEDGSVTVSVYILEYNEETGKDEEIYAGDAAKTKGKKILRLLQEHDPEITAELYGGKYWKMEDSGYVDDRWDEALTVRVYFKW